MAHEKSVFLNGEEIGTARAWPDVARLLGMTLDDFARAVLAGSVQRFEGPDGFHVTKPGDEPGSVLAND